MKSDVLIITLLALILVASGVAYNLGLKNGEKAAQSKWHDIGYANAEEDWLVKPEAFDCTSPVSQTILDNPRLRDLEYNHRISKGCVVPDTLTN